MDIQRIIDTPGILGLAHRDGDGNIAIDRCSDLIDPAILREMFVALEVSGENSVTLEVPREPHDLRYVAERHGLTVVVVALEQGHPACKSLRRLLRRSAKRPTPSTWLPPSATDASAPAPREHLPSGGAVEAVGHGLPLGGEP